MQQKQSWAEKLIGDLYYGAEFIWSDRMALDAKDVIYPHLPSRKVAEGKVLRMFYGVYQESFTLSQISEKLPKIPARPQTVLKWARNKTRGNLDRNNILAILRALSIIHTNPIEAARLSADYTAKISNLEARMCMLQSLLDLSPLKEVTVTFSVGFSLDFFQKILSAEYPIV